MRRSNVSGIAAKAVSRFPRGSFTFTVAPLAEALFLNDHRTCFSYL